MNRMVTSLGGALVKRRLLSSYQTSGYILFDPLTTNNPPSPATIVMMSAATTVAEITGTIVKVIMSPMDAVPPGKAAANNAAVGKLSVCPPASETRINFEFNISSAVIVEELEVFVLEVVVPEIDLIVPIAPSPDDVLVLIIPVAIAVLSERFNISYNLFSEKLPA